MIEHLAARCRQRGSPLADPRRRHVKQATGYSVGEWISAGRVAEAAARLAHTDDSVEQITGRVGRQDTTRSSGNFAKAYCVTPAAGRREHRAGHRR